MNILTEIKTWAKAFNLLTKTKREGSIFIARKNAIGDVLWAEPVIRELALQKKKFIVVTAYPELFENAPYKNIAIINESEKSYKRVIKILRWLNLNKNLIDLNHAYEKKPQMHFLHAYQAQAMLPLTDEYPKLYLSHEEKKMFSGLKPYVVIHTESLSIYNHRNIYGIDLQLIINYINEKGFKVYILSKNYSSYQNAFHLKTTLRELIALVYNASFFIGIDSGPSHIAASLNIPSIIFFGAVNPWYRHFQGKFNGIIMQQYCEHAGCYHRTERKKDNLFCLLVDKKSAPKCSSHTNIELLKNIDSTILKQYENEVNI